MITNEDVKKWKPLIKKVSWKYRNNKYRLDLEDIEQIGYIGLIRGLKCFNDDKGVKIQTHLYNYIKWSIDKELEYWKHDKRCTLHQSTSIDIKLNDAEDLTLGEMLEDISINIEKSVIDGLIVEKYREEIIKTLTNPQEQQIILMVLFDDLNAESISKKLNLNIENTRRFYKRGRDKLGRNMFIRSRYKEYKQNMCIERYKSINYYDNTENTTLKVMELEQQLFKIL
jgi:RNA polymerase sigma factor (sigma-70 family)